MSITTVEQAMSRIESARTSSPIAVFKSREEGKLETIFASTYWSQERIKSDKNFIGVFDRNMDLAEIRWMLKSYANENRAPLRSPLKATTFNIGASL